MESCFYQSGLKFEKKIRKQAGDFVKVILFANKLPVEIPEEILLCFLDIPGSLKSFQNQSEAEQIAQLQWIYSAKKEQTKVTRINTVIEKLVIKSV